MSFVSRHRTKLLGLAQCATGAVVANLSYVQQYLKPSHFGWGMVALGVTTSLLGFFNTWQERDDTTPNP